MLTHVRAGNRTDYLYLPDRPRASHSLARCLWTLLFSGVYPVTPPKDIQSESNLTAPPPAPRHTVVCWEIFLRFRLTACTLRQVHRRELPARNEHRAFDAERDSGRTTKEQLEFSESANGQRTVARWSM
jgi:hypothetical protein